MYGEAGDLWDMPLRGQQWRQWKVGQTFEVMGLRHSHYRVVEVHPDRLVIELRAGKWKPRRRPRLARLLLWLVVVLVVGQVGGYPALAVTALAAVAVRALRKAR